MNTLTKYLVTVLSIVAVIWLVERFVPATTSLGERVASDIPASSVQPALEKEGKYPRAQEFVKPGEFINAEPFTLASLIGKKVIIVDFWTYSCINCQRTQPYLNAWYEKYKDQGLEIVGVHTPEFDFEKVADNVRAAVKREGIVYPVVQDNEFGTWRAYQNQYWPHKYLIDTDGYIVYDQVGEGGYEEFETHVQRALAEHMARAGAGGEVASGTVRPGDIQAVDFSKIKTPEIYLGVFRNAQYLGNGTPSITGTQTLSMPASNTQKKNLVYLGGTWEFSDQAVRCVRDCVVRLAYSARQANIVAGSPTSQSIRVRLDGKDVQSVTVRADTLYHVIDQNTYGEHTLELTVPTGLSLFTFTFS